MYVAAEL